jgi:curved DNA binding protein
VAQEKYKAASEIANRVLIAILENLKPGVTVLEVCTYGDKLIEELFQQSSKKVKKNKGIAFPTCISINNCAGHYSPLPEDTQVVIKEGDVVKVDLGVHIDGFPSVVAHTWIVGQTAPATGKIADVVCAAYYASECALRLLRPGKTNTDVTNIIQKCAKSFNVQPLEAVLSHEIKRNCLDANKVIINRVELDQQVEEFQFEINQAYGIDIVMSTGEGKSREIDTRTTVFKRAVDRNYQLKLQASRGLLTEINSKFPNHAFSLRSLDEKKRRMGIVELVKHELVDSYPVLFEKDGEIIAQFKFTALILPNNTVRLNGPFPLPHVSSQYSIDQDTEIQTILKMNLARKKKRVNNKKAKNTTAVESMDTA